MTSTSPDLPRPNRRGFSCVAYDVAHDHREAAKTSSRRRTARSTPIACLQSVSVPPKQSCTSTASRAQCSPSSSAPGLQLHRARPARRLRSTVSGSRMLADGGWKTRPNQGYGVRTGSRISGGSEIAKALGIGRASVYRVLEAVR
jgi:hypothetical protein